ncbi:MAG: endonuclease III [Ignavibacteriaceae bacterium]|nr:endonuclease III [Ignavibacteriaceae bacterium]
MSKLTKRTTAIIELLKQHYPEAKIALNFGSPFQLLIATILAAQCTDERVNKLTVTLFKKYKEPNDFLIVSTDELEKDIFSTGFYRQKAKSIKNCCMDLVGKYEGRVPEDFDLLTALPGVGRKTASVIMGNAFGVPAIAVDTHVKRISNLLELVNEENPEKIESELKKIVPVEDWTIFSHLIATHGRNLCIARRPKCNDCFLLNHCPYGKRNNE